MGGIWRAEFLGRSTADMATETRTEGARPAGSQVRQSPASLSCSYSESLSSRCQGPIIVSFMLRGICIQTGRASFKNPRPVQVVRGATFHARNLPMPRAVLWGETHDS